MSLFSLYVHVSFCVSKCGYCSFYSRSAEESLMESWLDGVSREAGRLAAVWGGKIPLRTVYVGGGTPSILSAEVWERFFRILSGAFDASGVEEFTAEANPCSLTDGLLALWKDFRVTRVSLGVQSLDDGELAWLGRRHDARTALAALEKILFHGFGASADLLFGLPRQTLRTWRDSLRRVLASGAGHVSAYQLTLEPGTPLGDAGVPLPDGYPFYRFAQWYLGRKGYAQYEIASFARPGRECRHNLAYWRQENVLALGPSAWGYLRLPGGGFRYRNARTLEEYCARTGLPIAEAETLEGRAQGAEAAILALRTREGIGVAGFAARFGEKLAEDVTAALKKIPTRLVSFENGSIRLTPGGMRVGNAIWVELLELGE